MCKHIFTQTFFCAFSKKSASQIKFIGVKYISSKIWIKGIHLVYLLEAILDFKKGSYKISPRKIRYQCAIFSKVESLLYAF